MLFNLAEVREKFDAGLGARMFQKYRALETAKDDDPWERMEAKYRVVILGAVMMRIGAKLSEDDVQHLRELADTA